MNADEHGQPPGNRRPTAHDGPFTLIVDGGGLHCETAPGGTRRLRLRMGVGAEQRVRIFEFPTGGLFQHPRPSRHAIRTSTGNG